MSSLKRSVAARGSNQALYNAYESSPAYTHEYAAQDHDIPYCTDLGKIEYPTASYAPMPVYPFKLTSKFNIPSDSSDYAPQIHGMQQEAAYISCDPMITQLAASVQLPGNGDDDNQENALLDSLHSQGIASTSRILQWPPSADQSESHTLQPPNLMNNKPQQASFSSEVQVPKPTIPNVPAQWDTFNRNRGSIPVNYHTSGLPKSSNAFHIAKTRHDPGKAKLSYKIGKILLTIHYYVGSLTVHMQ